MQHNKILIRQLGLQPYEPVSQAMHEFTDARDEDTLDEIWLVEHHPVFTQGQAGKAEHVLVPGDIPVIQSDRGGQVTYHGPGQQVMYVLLDLKRRKLGVRELVTLLEQTVVNTLAEYSIESHPAPTPLASMSANAKSALWDCGSVKVVLSTVWRLISPWISHRFFAYQPLRLCRYGDDANAPVAAGSLPETVAPRLVANLLALLNHPPHEYLSRD